MKAIPFFLLEIQVLEAFSCASFSGLVLPPPFFFNFLHLPHQDLEDLELDGHAHDRHGTHHAQLNLHNLGDGELDAMLSVFCEERLKADVPHIELWLPERLDDGRSPCAWEAWSTHLLKPGSRVTVDTKYERRRAHKRRGYEHDVVVKLRYGAQDEANDGHGCGDAHVAIG